jgi:hypothetical protein
MPRISILNHPCIFITEIVLWGGHLLWNGLLLTHDFIITTPVVLTGFSWLWTFSACVCYRYLWTLKRWNVSACSVKLSRYFPFHYLCTLLCSMSRRVVVGDHLQTKKHKAAPSSMKLTSFFVHSSVDEKWTEMGNRGRGVRILLC